MATMMVVPTTALISCLHWLQTTPHDNRVVPILHWPIPLPVSRVLGLHCTTCRVPSQAVTVSSELGVVGAVSAATCAHSQRSHTANVYHHARTHMHTHTHTHTHAHVLRTRTHG